MGVWRRICCVSLLTLVLLIGLVALVAFPLAIFPPLVDLNLPIAQDSNGKFTTIGHYWWKLPLIGYYDFYFFNVTNPDAVVYLGEKPSLQQVGPYSYREYEEKVNYSFYNDAKMVYYENRKKWIFSPETSCPDCGYEDVLNLPNAPFVTTQYLLAKNNVTGGSKFITELLSTLLGEYPFRVVPMKGVLFLTYPDPLANLLNSPLFAALQNLTGGQLLPFDPPDIKDVGYFPKYNNTGDENYRVFTGKGDLKKTNVVSQWANGDKLTFWSDDYANNIQGATDGAFNPPHIKKTDTVPLFISLGCRTFYLKYDSSISVRSIPAYKFKLDPANLDTTLAQNKGFRYNNSEQIDYFPNWPCGGQDPYDPIACGTQNVDCMDPVNFCHSCCHGSSVDNRRLLPPGMIPLGCLPDYRFVNASEFSNANFVRNVSRYGFPVSFTNGRNRIIRADLIAQKGTIEYSNGFAMNLLPSTIVPSFWLDTRVTLEDYVYDYLHTNIVVLPTIIMSVGGVLVGLVLLVIVIYGCWKWRSARKRKHGTLEMSEYDRRYAKFHAEWNQ